MTTGSVTTDLRVLTHLNWPSKDVEIGNIHKRTWIGVDASSNGDRGKWHSYDATISTVSDSEVRFYFTSTPTTLRKSWAPDRWGAATSVTPTEPDVTALWAGMAGMVSNSSFNAAITAAELSKSLDTIAHAARRVAKSLHALKRGNIPKAISALGCQYVEAGIFIDRNNKKRRYRRIASSSPSSTWLELQYGWLPLLSDIHAAGETYFRLTNKPRVNSFIYGKTNYGDQSFTKATIKKKSIFYRKTLHYWQTEDYSIADSLGLTNPLSLAWELLPFSFVADWFYPLGSYLEARNFAANAKGSYAYVDFKRTHYAVQEGSYVISGAVYPLVPNYGKYEVDYVVFKRSALQNLTGWKDMFGSNPVPLPRFKPLAKIASVRHIITSAALWRVLTR